MFPKIRKEAKMPTTPITSQDGFMSISHFYQTTNIKLSYKIDKKKSLRKHLILYLEKLNQSIIKLTQANIHYESRIQNYIQ